MVEEAGEVEVRRPEQQLHIAVADYLDAALPEECWWTSIEHGLNHGRVAGALAKRRGVKSGLPDVWIIWLTYYQVTVKGHPDADAVAIRRPKLICIELKHGNNKPTKRQQECHAELRRVGVDVGVCYSVEGVSDYLDNLGVPLRVKLGLE